MSEGLRERKKKATRLAISDIATGLFIARGFDQVTLAEVARVANVSVNTIFNYFETKEELFFDREPEAIEEPSRVVRERAPGESAVEALERHFRATIASKMGLFRQSPNIQRFFATIEASPSLRARQLLMYSKSEHALAETLRAEAGAKASDPMPRAVAAMATGLLWMLVDDFRARILRGETDAAIRRELAKLANGAFALLRAAAGDYARKAGGDARPPSKALRKPTRKSKRGAASSP